MNLIKPEHRVEIAKIKVNDQLVVITSDAHKTYASTHFDRLRDDHLEVGVSKGNGSASPDTAPECVAHMKAKAEAVDTKVYDSDIGWLSFLHNVAIAVNASYNEYLETK